VQVGPSTEMSASGGAAAGDEPQAAAQTIAATATTAIATVRYHLLCCTIDLWGFEVPDRAATTIHPGSFVRRCGHAADRELPLWQVAIGANAVPARAQQAQIPHLQAINLAVPLALENGVLAVKDGTLFTSGGVLNINGTLALQDGPNWSNHGELSLTVAGTTVGSGCASRCKVSSALNSDGISKLSVTEVEKVTFLTEKVSVIQKYLAHYIVLILLFTSIGFIYLNPDIGSRQNIKNAWAYANSHGLNDKTIYMDSASYFSYIFMDGYEHMSSVKMYLKGNYPYPGNTVLIEPLEIHDSYVLIDWHIFNTMPKNYEWKIPSSISNPPENWELMETFSNPRVTEKAYLYYAP